MIDPNYKRDRSDLPEDERVRLFQEAAAGIRAKREKQQIQVIRDVEKARARDLQQRRQAEQKELERKQVRQETVQIAKSAGKSALLIGCWSAIMIPFGFALTFIAIATASPAPVVLWFVLFGLSILLMKPSKKAGVAPITRLDETR